jgi:hypothetical protein
MNILLPNKSGELSAYSLTGEPVLGTPMGKDSTRVVYSAAHVVADPFSDIAPMGLPGIDWDKTMAFRHHLADLGLGIAEAMDTAQRGMGLDWAQSLELIRCTKAELPNALVANGCGTDHLSDGELYSLEDVRRAYLEQVEAIQNVGGRIILMASRALARAANEADDYISIYNDVLAACDEPVILHWLGDMFDPALAGYWGAQSFEDALPTVLEIITANEAKVDGIKISLLDAAKEITMRQQLPATVRMYTGDDFNYPELISGDGDTFSHALLGIFDPLANHAASAIEALSKGDAATFHAILDPTVPLARHIFRAPTRHYKTGVVFLAWLNGHQDHFKMLGGEEAMRALPYFVDCFKLADACGALAKPDLACERMGHLLKLYGV